MYMAGKFVIKKGRTGQFRFSLVGRNGQIVATSATYTTRASCMNGIKSVKTLAAGAPIEDQTNKETVARQAGKAAGAAKVTAKRATKVVAKAAKAAITEATPAAKKTAQATKKAVSQAAPVKRTAARTRKTSTGR
jgi:uncharacterized protein YegP (UPF0339 family)